MDVLYIAYEHRLIYTNSKSRFNLILCHLMSLSIFEWVRFFLLFVCFIIITLQHQILRPKANFPTFLSWQFLLLIPTSYFTILLYLPHPIFLFAWFAMVCLLFWIVLCNSIWSPLKLHFSTFQSEFILHTIQALYILSHLILIMIILNWVLDVPFRLKREWFVTVYNYQWLLYAYQNTVYFHV